RALSIILMTTNETVKMFVTNTIGLYFKGYLYLNEPFSSRYWKFMEACLSRRTDNPIRDTVVSEVMPVIEESQHVANAELRKRCVQLYCQAFPVADCTLPPAEYDRALLR